MRVIGFMLLGALIFWIGSEIIAINKTVPTTSYQKKSVKVSKPKKPIVKRVAKRAYKIVPQQNCEKVEEAKQDYEVIEPPPELLESQPRQIQQPPPAPVQVVYIQREPDPYEIMAAQRMQTPMMYARYQQYGAYDR